MRILVVGNGARENAMLRSLAANAAVVARLAELTGKRFGPLSLYTVPGNIGGERWAKPLTSPLEVPSLVALAQQEHIDLVIPGGETLLVAGLQDALQTAKLLGVGPSKAAAQLEGSKAFMRELTAALQVPGPDFRIVSSVPELRAALAHFATLPVIKASFLAAGKGVFLPTSTAECLRVGERLLTGELLDGAGRELVLEERLVGREASLFYACYVNHREELEIVSLPSARDHKRLQTGDLGPNTGGMGAISPNTLLSKDLATTVLQKMILPTLKGLYQRGAPFQGFLFAGLMLTPQGPKLLEYNVRLGDPEAQAILPRLLSGQLLALAYEMATGGELLPNLEPVLLGGRQSLDLGDLRAEVSTYQEHYTGRLGGEAALDDTVRQPTCAVVIAAPNYPEGGCTPVEVAIPPEINTPERWVEYAGVYVADGKLFTRGGRVFTVVARGATSREARERAYAGVELLKFPDCQVRTDIGVLTEHV